MHKLFIADDEKIVIDTLKDAIDWDSMDIEIIGTATDGKSAWESIQQHKPHIVLTDIRMPELTGLELIREIRKMGDETECIIMSGYTEFTYAKTAIELEAIDYLIKPIELEDIAEAIQKSIVKREKNLSLKRKQIIDVTLGYEDASPSEFRFDRCTLVVASLPPSEIHQWSDDRVLNKLIPGYPQSLEPFIFIHEGKVISIIHGSAEDFLDQWKQAMALDEGDAHTFPAIGVAKSTDGHANLNQMFRNAKEVSDFARFFLLSILDYDQFSLIIAKQTDIDLDKISTHLRVNHFDSEKMKADIEQFLNECLNHFVLPYKIKEMCFQFMGQVAEYVKHEFDLNVGHIIGDNYRVLEEINQSITIEKLKTWLTDRINEISAYIESNRVSYKDKFVMDVKQYIKEHYTKNITLDDIGSQFNMSPAYLSSLFSKSVKMTLFEYIIQLRMQKAKELLRSSHYKITEISKSVGYENQRYFCQVFKKNVGITPGEYRSEHQLKTN